MDAVVIESLIVGGTVILGLSAWVVVLLRQNRRLRRQRWLEERRADSWREIAQRAQFVAEMALGNTKRATNTMTKVKPS